MSDFVRKSTISYNNNDYMLWSTNEEKTISVTLVELKSNKIINKVYKNMICETRPDIEMVTIFEYIIKYSVANKNINICGDNIYFMAHLTENLRFQMYNCMVNLSDDSDTLHIDRKQLDTVSECGLKKECLKSFCEENKLKEIIKGKDNEIIELKKTIANNRAIVSTIVADSGFVPDSKKTLSDYGFVPDAKKVLNSNDNNKNVPVELKPAIIIKGEPKKPITDDDNFDSDCVIVKTDEENKSEQLLIENKRLAKIIDDMKKIIN